MRVYLTENLNKIKTTKNLMFSTKQKTIKNTSVQRIFLYETDVFFFNSNSVTQQVLTKDSVTVSVDAVVYYRVCNATISVANVANAHQSTRLLAQTTLRNVLGTRPLHEILSDRDAISKNMQVLLDEATESWGIKVERVEM